MENELVRKDSWNKSDDRLLTETVLRHIQSGSTQLEAFEEVSNRLGRTSAACGFRWNATVRQNYTKEIRDAKLIRHSNKREDSFSKPHFRF